MQRVSEDVAQSAANDETLKQRTFDNSVRDVQLQVSMSQPRTTHQLGQRFQGSSQAKSVGGLADLATALEKFKKAFQEKKIGASASHNVS